MSHESIERVCFDLWCRQQHPPVTGELDSVHMRVLWRGWLARSQPVAPTIDRAEVAKTILAGLCSGIEWQAGLLIHSAEMAADAVDLADHLIKALKQ
jgi:hypothetical protein